VWWIADSEDSSSGTRNCVTGWFSFWHYEESWCQLFDPEDKCTIVIWNRNHLSSSTASRTRTLRSTATCWKTLYVCFVLYAQLLRTVSTPGHPFIACYILLLFSTKSCLGLLTLMILQNIRNCYLMMESYILPDLKLQLDSLFFSVSQVLSLA